MGRRRDIGTLDQVVHHKAEKLVFGARPMPKAQRPRNREYRSANAAAQRPNQKRDARMAREHRAQETPHRVQVGRRAQTIHDAQHQKVRHSDQGGETPRQGIEPEPGRGVIGDAVRPQRRLTRRKRIEKIRVEHPHCHQVHDAVEGVQPRRYGSGRRTKINPEMTRGIDENQSGNHPPDPTRRSSLAHAEGSRVNNDSISAAVTRRAR